MFLVVLVSIIFFVDSPISNTFLFATVLFFTILSVSTLHLLVAVKAQSLAMW